jgi:uncharacterized OB-fold protein
LGLLKKFYDALVEGKIVGLKCKSCGMYVFPPKPVCQKCFSRDLDWVQLSGDGKLLCFSSSIMPAPQFRDYVPYAYGLVKLNEGPVFYTMITGIDVSNPARIKENLERLPINVKAEIKKIAGLHIITFRIIG